MSAKTMLIAFLGAALVACAASDPSPDDAPTPLAGQLDNSGYVLVQPDPVGGYLVHSLNGAATACPGGSAGECHVNDVDVSKLGLDPEQEKQVKTAAAQGQLVVRGDVAATLVATEAWVGVGEQLGGGTFARVASTGIVCVAAPCPSWHAWLLDQKEHQDLAGVDFGAAGLTPREVDAAQLALRAPGGLIVAAKEYDVSGPAGHMPGYLVNQVYLPARAPIVAGMVRRGCFVGGCSAELCSDDARALSPCVFRPELECYRSAECTRQADGRCGWTQTDRLKACLANPPALE